MTLQSLDVAKIPDSLAWLVISVPTGINMAFRVLVPKHTDLGDMSCNAECLLVALVK